ncbi:3-oxoacyl-[acyl-carrier-protein] synthase III [Scenedesmus sp. PABB004]|nr:3-oxoacyl-[acyl-carrier-protein] synthase III [Scenedesmus sp. PABB004]
MQAGASAAPCRAGGARAFTQSARAPRPSTLRARARAVRASAAQALVGCKLAGVGSSVPSTVLSNADLEAWVETSDEWIASRTGIRRRHVLAEGETMGEHAVEASRRALEMAGVSAEEVNMVIMATSTPDDAFGGACQVQAALGATGAVAFDLTAACSGFVLGLVTASQYVRTGMAKHVLVIGADAMSRVVDWRDRGTCILFGDGCGAVLVSAAPDGAPCSLLGVDMHSDGRGQKSLHAMYSGCGGKPFQDGGAASTDASYGNVAMAGQEVFKFAVRSVPAVIDAALEQAGLAKEDVDWLVMHQANQRILDAAATRLGLPAERVVSNLAEYGNTSAASIPLALDEAVRGGKVKPGDVLAMAGFGAGLTWAGAIVRWG